MDEDSEFRKDVAKLKDDGEVNSSEPDADLNAELTTGHYTMVSEMACTVI